MKYQVEIEGASRRFISCETEAEDLMRAGAETLDYFRRETGENLRVTCIKEIGPCKNDFPKHSMGCSARLITAA